MENAAIKKRAAHRVKIISGQLNGLLRAIEKGEYCIDILHQSLSIQESLKSLDALLLENHLKTCVKKNIARKDDRGRTVKELLKIYKLSKR
jgi:DNA-binding FrmR family transcriptional regulator